MNVLLMWSIKHIAYDTNSKDVKLMEMHTGLLMMVHYAAVSNVT